MNDQQRIIMPIVGIAIAVLLAVVLFEGAGDGFEWLFGILLLTLFNPLFWIIFLIAVLVRRGGRGQQQQQQVVIVTGGGTQAAPRLRCPKCKGLSPDTARFCGHCGVALA